MSKITTISIDAMGGDRGLQTTVPAVVQFFSKLQNAEQYKILVVGLADKILPFIEQHNGQHLIDNGQIEIVSATEVVAMDESPALALKKKKDSSMRVAINLVNEGVAQACVSAGNTGALMAIARFVLKTIPGVNRPAICSAMPCKDSNQTVHMLDLGANVDCSPEMLVQFAIMGAVLTEYVDNKQAPRIALLNVGAEDIKGSEKVKQTSILLSETELNYVGYIEGNEIYDGKVDVIVCDGFEGNIALKTSEGTANMVIDVLKQEFKRNLLTKLAAMLCKPIFNGMRTRLDPRRYNGATLIGLNGIVVKSHGGTDALGFLYAIEEAAQQAQIKVVEHIKEQVKKSL